MKIKGVVLLLVVLVVMSFNRLNSEKHIVITKDSKVEWKGFKPTGNHFGTITIKEGSLIVEGDKLISGSFTMDMNSIQLLDSESKKLLGHLKSSDFFDVEKFPTATFEITEVKDVEGKLSVSGNLTAKGISKNITIPATLTNDQGALTFTSETFKVDRTEFGIQYKSTKLADVIKEKSIDDLFEMSFEVKVSK